MKKITSILILALLLLPDISHSISTFFGHSHEICTEDGIHYHENENDCITCIFSNNNFTDTNQLSKNLNINVECKESLVYLINSVYRKLSTLNLSSRAPPITL